MFGIGIMAGAANIKRPVLDGLWAWHDAADPSLVTLEDTDRVIEWADKSGNGRHLARPAGSSDRPYYGSRQRNGLNVVDFRGAHGLAWALGEQITAMSNVTCLMVLQADAIAARVVLNASSSVRVYACEIQVNNSNYGASIARLHGTDGTAAVYAKPGLALTTEAFITGFSRDGAVLTGYANDMTDTNTPAGFTTQGAMQVGRRSDSTLSFDGAIAEILIYGKTLSLGQLGHNMGYLRNKWGL